MLAAAACLSTGLVVSVGIGSMTPPEQRVAHSLNRPAVDVGESAPSMRPARLDPTPERQRVAKAVVLKPRPEPEKREPKKKQKAVKPAVLPPADFVISSFNVLGSSHTRGNGGMAPGPVRVRNAAQLLNMHGVSIAGLQELQGDQFRSLMGATGGAFGVYPGMAAGPLGVENSIVWRRSVWALESASTIAIPYFDGRQRPMPYILLRHVASGRKVWVGNFHNPATNGKRGNNDRWRAAAAARETALAARLRSETGYPVFILGDMNDREAYFCRITAGAPMVAANGGSNNGRCIPPPHPMPVDWIFGSDEVAFSGYVRDYGPLVRRTSDHAMIRARVLLEGADGVPAANAG
jgi:hypothetical protein